MQFFLANKKRKYTTKSKSEKKQCAIRSDVEENETQKSNMTSLDEKERKLAIREKEIALEEREAELELKKLNIAKMKKDLNL